MSEESVGDAGANNLGYFTGCFSPQGNHILAHGFTGALHLWKRPGAAPLPLLLLQSQYLFWPPYHHHSCLLLSQTASTCCPSQVCLLPYMPRPLTALSMHANCPETAFWGPSVSPLPLSPSCCLAIALAHCSLVSLRAACMVQGGKRLLVGSQGMP